MGDWHSPLTGALNGQLDNAVSREVVGQQGRMARKRFQEKTNKYRARVVANGFGFVLIIFDSSGHIHDQLKRFLQVSVKKAMKTRKINWNNAYAYLVKRLSVTL